MEGLVAIKISAALRNEIANANSLAKDEVEVGFDILGNQNASLVPRGSASVIVR
jgi:hypothetical protein